MDYKDLKKEDLKYLEWLKTQPCVKFGFDCQGDIVPAHQNLFYGIMGGKSFDRWALPLCMYHHTMSQAAEHSGKKTFWRGYELAQLIIEHNIKYDVTRGLYLCKALLRV